MTSLSRPGRCPCEAEPIVEVFLQQQQALGRSARRGGRNGPGVPLLPPSRALRGVRSCVESCLHIIRDGLLLGWSEATAGYFRRILTENPHLLKPAANKEDPGRWLQDHPSEDRPNNVKATSRTSRAYSPEAP